MDPACLNFKVFIEMEMVDSRIGACKCQVNFRNVI